MLPLECRYLNKSALTTLAGPLTPPVKHFQLKRKPKSATLRAELLQKCECRVPGLDARLSGACSVCLALFLDPLGFPALNCLFKTLRVLHKALGFFRSFIAMLNCVLKICFRNYRMFRLKCL